MMKNSTSHIGIGVIGTGGMGGRHAYNAHKKIVGARVVGVFDVDEKRARQTAADCGNAANFDDPGQLIEDERIQAVIIASPDATHVGFVLACLENLKPVLCEKPLATRADEAWRVIEAEDALGRKLVAVGFMRRFDAQHVGLKEAIDGGIVGQPVAFKGIHRNESIPSNFPANSVISQAAIHDIDSCRWLLKREIEEVFVQGTRVDRSLNSDVRELLLLQFSLADNRLASIEVHLSARYGYEVSAEVIGELGVVTTNQPASINIRVDGERSTKIPSDWLGRFQEAYVAELENWVASINGHSFDGADAWDGYVSLVISDACIKSLLSGRPERVTLPKKPTLYH